MRPVSDAFLVQVAEISAILIGLFLVGIFFYAETGFRQLEESVREAIETYFRAATRIVLLLYALPLFLSLTLVVLSPGWNRVVFLILSVMLVAANVDSFRRVRSVPTGTSAVWRAHEIAGTIAVGILVLLPWVLGGLHPTREDLTWSILISFATGFLSVGVLVLSVFDAPGREH